jgi:predicted RecB family nuclease
VRSRAGDNWQELVSALTERVASLESKQRLNDMKNQELKDKMKKKFKKVSSDNSKLSRELEQAKQQVQNLTSCERRHPTGTLLDQGVDEQAYQQLLARITTALGTRFVSRLYFQNGAGAPSP